MHRVLSNQVHDFLNREVILAGWVHRVRNLGGLQFVILRDRSGMVQLVYNGIEELFEPESVLQISGTVVANEQAPDGVEVQVEDTKVLARPAKKMPLAAAASPQEYGIEATLDHRLSSLRNPAIRSIFALESVLIDVFGTFLRSRGFTEIKTSKLIGTGTEGGTGLFSVQYFDQKVYLAQSPQFYKQAMVASGLERVFEVAPAYRAEKHETSRHLNEYISLDVEMGFIKDEHDIMDIEGELLVAIMEAVTARCGHILATWNASIPDPAAFKKIPRCTYADAKKIVKDRTKKTIFDISPEAERELCDWAQDEHGIPAVFVYDFPKRKRPFYTYPSGRGTRSFDLLYGGLEITTGGQRIHEYQMLCTAIAEQGLSEDALSDYMTIFAYGCPPHGGFAIGLERLAQTILGLKNVKEAAAFVRDRRRIRP